MKNSFLKRLARFGKEFCECGNNQDATAKSVAGRLLVSSWPSSSTTESFSADSSLR